MPEYHIPRITVQFSDSYVNYRIEGTNSFAVVKDGDFPRNFDSKDDAKDFVRSGLLLYLEELQNV